MVGKIIVMKLPVSTGRPGHPTPIGDFHIAPRQEHGHKSSKYGSCVSDHNKRNGGLKPKDCKEGEKFIGAPMEYWQPFAPEVGFHQGAVPHLSHGCVHVRPGEAKKLFDWATKGTPVKVAPHRPPKKKSPPPKKPCKKNCKKKTTTQA